MDYDLVVLGGGSAGYAAALRGAQLGMTVALIEGDKLGGTCLHRGCIPTKALLHSAEVADTVRESGAFGVLSTFGSSDMSAVHAFKDSVVGRLYKGLQGLVSSRKVDLIGGWGRLVAPDTVDCSCCRATALLTPSVRSALGRKAGAIATDEHSRRRRQLRDAALGENAAAAAAAAQARYRSEHCGKRPHEFILFRGGTSGQAWAR